MVQSFASVGDRSETLTARGDRRGTAFPRAFSRLVSAAGIGLVAGVLATATPGKAASTAEDEKTVYDLDTAYQAAVEKNDVEGMDRILADDFALVTGRGQSFNKKDLLDEARKKSTIYEKQVDSEKTVRVYGDTAVVTALLWIKGTREGKPIEYKLWFSDVYLRRAEGWRYVFGQASLRLPDEK